jgi:hypothetical protein
MATARSPWTLGLEPPRFGACGCCGGRTTNLVRFVYRDGAPYAVYYAAFAENHPEEGIDILVGLGDWSATGSPERRSAFALRLMASPAGSAGPRTEVMEGEGSPWRTATLVGRLLSREEALAHPLLAEALQVLEEMVARDPEVRAYLGARASVSAAIPEA